MIAPCGRARSLMLALAVLAGPAPALADAWDARLPDGRSLHIVEHSARTRDGYVLERRYPDGTVDAQFGQDGSVVFRLGPDNDGPAALRTDALGRAWIAGASYGDGQTRAVVLRFLPLGAPATSYAGTGRVAMAPAGRQARALDLLPLADGSAWVAGIVFDDPSNERAGWWRVNPDGRVDTRFGLGGQRFADRFVDALGRLRADLDRPGRRLHLLDHGRVPQDDRIVELEHADRLVQAARLPMNFRAAASLQTIAPRAPRGERI